MSGGAQAVVFGAGYVAVVQTTTAHFNIDAIQEAIQVAGCVDVFDVVQGRNLNAITGDDRTITIVLERIGIAAAQVDLYRFVVVGGFQQQPVAVLSGLHVACRAIIGSNAAVNVGPVAVGAVQLGQFGEEEVSVTAAGQVVRAAPRLSSAAASEEVVTDAALDDVSTQTTQHDVAVSADAVAVKAGAVVSDVAGEVVGAVAFVQRVTGVGVDDFEVLASHYTSSRNVVLYAVGLNAVAAVKVNAAQLVVGVGHVDTGVGIASQTQGGSAGTAIDYDIATQQSGNTAVGVQIDAGHAAGGAAGDVRHFRQEGETGVLTTQGIADAAFLGAKQYKVGNRSVGGAAVELAQIGIDVGGYFGVFTQITCTIELGQLGARRTAFIGTKQCVVSDQVSIAETLLYIGILAAIEIGVEPWIRCIATLGTHLNVVLEQIACVRRQADVACGVMIEVISRIKWFELARGGSHCLVEGFFDHFVRKSHVFSS